YSYVETTTFFEVPVSLPLAFGAGPASVLQAVTKSQQSRCRTNAITSPQALQPRQLKTCLLVLIENLSVPPQTGQGPTRSMRPRSLIPRCPMMRSMGTERARSMSSTGITLIALAVSGWLGHLRVREELRCPQVVEASGFEPEEPLVFSTEPRESCRPRPR